MCLLALSVCYVSFDDKLLYFCEMNENIKKSAFYMISVCSIVEKYGSIVSKSYVEMALNFPYFKRRQQKMKFTSITRRSRIAEA